MSEKESLLSKLLKPKKSCNSGCCDMKIIEVKDEQKTEEQPEEKAEE